MKNPNEVDDNHGSLMAGRAATKIEARKFPQQGVNSQQKI